MKYACSSVIPALPLSGEAKIRLQKPDNNYVRLYIIFILKACIDDNLDMVEFLVQRGADVNRGDNEGWTPLHATASCGFLSIAR